MHATANDGYEFVDWTEVSSESASVVSTDADYSFGVERGRLLVASFARVLTVRWLDADGLDLQCKSYREGEVEPEYTGPVPTKADTEGFTYTFSGWKPGKDDGTVKTYKATFDAKAKSPDGPTPPVDPTPSDDPTPPIGPASSDDPSKQLAPDGTAFGPGASQQAAEAATAAMTSDEDPAGTTFAPLKLRSTRQAGKSVTLKWSKAPGAASYVLFGGKRGKGNGMVKIATLAKTSCKVTEIADKKLEKGAYYKFMIVATDDSGKVVSSSKIAYVATKGGKNGNYKGVTTKAKKNRVALKTGKAFKLRARATPASKKLKVRNIRRVMYESTDSNVATVSRAGKVKARAKGTCYVYAYAQNGVFAKVKVVVK